MREHVLGLGLILYPVEVELIIRETTFLFAFFYMAF